MMPASYIQDLYLLQRVVAEWAAQPEARARFRFPASWLGSGNTLPLGNMTAAVEYAADAATRELVLAWDEATGKRCSLLQLVTVLEVEAPRTLEAVS